MDVLGPGIAVILFKKKRSAVFDEKLGSMKGIIVQLKMKHRNTTQMHESENALKPMFDADIKRLVKMVVLYPVPHSVWATPHEVRWLCATMWQFQRTKTTSFSKLRIESCLRNSPLCVLCLTRFQLTTNRYGSSILISYSIERLLAGLMIATRGCPNMFVQKTSTLTYLG